MATDDFTFSNTFPTTRLAWLGALAIAASLTTVLPAAAKTVPQADPFAAVKPAAKASRPTGRSPQASARQASRDTAPVVTVSSTGAGQAGYIHYFVITGPDGERESHVGIELPGDQIVHAFPEMGVVATPFAKRGTLTTAKGSIYEVEHLYGIRPYPDDKAMRGFQQQLAARVKPWLDENTPYCDEQSNTPRMCVSCLGFALRVLYPGAGQLLPALPADFKAAR